MDESSRPKLWLLRTRRFWFGILLLMLLVGTWIGSMNCNITVRHHGFILDPEINNQSGSQDLDYARGCISLTKGDVSWRDLDDPSNTIPGTFLKQPWSWIYSEEIYESMIFPNFYSESHAGAGGARISSSEVRKHLTLPLWLPVLLWLIIWPLWIRRLTRKEAAHFAKLQ